MAALVSDKQYCGYSRDSAYVGPSIANVRQCMEKVEKARASSRTPTELKRSGVAETGHQRHPQGRHARRPVGHDGLALAAPRPRVRADVFEREAKILRLQKKGKLKGEPPTLQSQCAAAYKRTVEPFHGWISRRAFAAAQGMTPSWEEVRERACLGCDSDEAFQKELASLSAATRELCELLQKVHVKYDMEDKRRSI